MSSRVVLVTGGATGIGAAVARRVIAEGAAVVIAPGAVPALDSQAWHADLNQNLTSVFYRLLGAPPDGELAGPAPNPTGRVAGPDEIASIARVPAQRRIGVHHRAALAIDGGFTAQ